MEGMQVTPQIENKNRLTLSSAKVLVILGLIIIIIGLPITVFLAKSRTEPRSKAATPPTQTKLALKLILSSPQDNLATNQEVITIVGSVNKKAVIIITGGSADEAIETTNQFSQNYSLREGDNQIEVFAFDEEGRKVSETRNVLYVKEPL